MQDGLSSGRSDHAIVGQEVYGRFSPFPVVGGWFYKDVEKPVSVPTTLALFGLALVGLGSSKRNR
ncbi:MAG: hypothetical protein ACI9JM_003461 [Halioglobus sp.]|jgi:hypothetical protein